MTNESRLIISIDARNAERTAQGLSRELDNIQRGGNQADRQVNQLGASLRSLAGYMAGIVTVSSAISKIDIYTNLQNRLKLVTNSQEELNKATKDTFDIAQRSGQVWGEVAMVYQRFADNAKKLNITQAQTAALTETVSKSIAVSGGSAASAEAALMQFGQALASGVLRGEEFNSIAEQAPALLKAIATGLGVDIGQLREMAKEGKLTGSVVVGALEKSKVAVDELFDKTDFTIGNSFTMLNNAVTQFVGEAGKGSGAASLLSNSIRTLAENLGLIADVAVVGGIALATKAIIAKTVAIQGAISASIAQRAADTAAAQSQIRLLALEVQRTRQVAALALTETGLARIEYNNATTRTARAAATVRLTQAEVALALATNRTTAAIAAETAAQSALNASRTLGTRALALVGGPIGAITIGVAALAAGYIYLSGKTEDANKKIEEQAKVANQAREALLALQGLEKDEAIESMTKSFERQNKALSESSAQINIQLGAIKRLYSGNAEVVKIVEDARNGTITMTEAIKKFNEIKISKDIYESIKKNSAEFVKNAEEAKKTQASLGLFNIEVKLAGKESQNAAVNISKNSDALDENATAAEKAAAAQKAYSSSLSNKKYEAEFTKNALALGLSESQIASGLDAANYARKSGVKLTQEMVKEAYALGAIEDGNKATIEARNEALSDGVKKQKEALALAKKQKKEADDLAEQQGKDRVSIAYSYLDDLKKLEADYYNEIELIRKSKFGAEEKDFEARAKARYDYNHESYLIQINDEISFFKRSDDERLDHWKRTQDEIVENSGRYNDEIKALKLKSLNEEYALEKAKILLSKQEREFQVKEQFLTETAAMNERYRLQQANILLINDASERAHLLELNRLAQQTEAQTRLDKAKAGIDSINSDRNGTGKFDDIYTAQAEANNASQELLDAQIAAGYENTEQLQKEHLDRMTENARVAKEAMLSLEFSYGEQITSSLADTFKTLAGEQSKAYKIMFAASKAFAIAQSIVSISQGIAAAASLPFPTNLPAIATVIAETSSIVSNIKSVTDAGFKTGGYTGSGGTSDVAGVVHGQEYVLNANATKRVGVDTLNAINSGGDLKSSSPVNIVINTPQGYTATTNQNGDTVTIDIVERAIQRSWSNVKNANSNESRAMQSAFALSPSR